MIEIRTYNKLSPKVYELLPKENYHLSEDIENPDAIILRSQNLHDIELPESLKVIVRLGAGVNNIPLERCKEKGIEVMNTPGANSNAVKELTICALLLASRDILGGAKWAEGLTENVAKSVEKGKGAFGGTEIKGKTLAVIGLGAIGRLVAEAAEGLGMDIVAYDPFAKESKYPLLSLDEAIKDADFISLHLPSNESTRGLVDCDFIGKMKDGAVILNFSRSDIVKAECIKKMLESGKLRKYVTDFPTEETLGVEGIINLPHLGASTFESEENCAIIGAKRIRDFFGV